MISVRIWNVESDRDAKAVKFLENEFMRFRQLNELSIRKSGRSALRKCHKKGAPVSSSLRKAIQYYLMQDNYIVFVVDVNQQHQQGTSPLVDHLRCVVKDCDFSDRVFFAEDIQEQEPSMPIQWQTIVSDFRTQVEGNHKQFQEEWERTVKHFHDAFADTPEEEVIRDFEEALAEVRRERT